LLGLTLIDYTEMPGVLISHRSRLKMPQHYHYQPRTFASARDVKGSRLIRIHDRGRKPG
jgi:hypothetical protein